MPSQEIKMIQGVKKVNIDRSMFSSEEAYNAFVNCEDGYDWSYNITKNKFGYGSDTNDWCNAKDEFLDASEIVCIEDDYDGKSVMIYYIKNSDDYETLTIKMHRSLFLTEEAYRAFIKHEDGWDWHYNKTRNIFGTEEDAMYEWEGEGDEIIYPYQRNGIFISDDYKNITIHYVR